MNRIVRAWNRSHSRPKYDGPDAVSIGDTKKQVLSEDEMAVRKTPETGPIFDNPALRADPTRDDSKIVAMLSRARFNSVIKLVKTAPLDVVLQIRNLTYNTIKRLRLKRNTDLTVKGIPSGSDQVNVKSISDWLNRVTVNDKRAIKQILQIDATAVARGS